MNKLDENFKIKEIKIQDEVVSQKLIFLLWNENRMFEETQLNLFNELKDINEVIEKIQSNLNKINPDILELYLVTFKWSTIKKQDIERLKKLGIKNIKLFSWWVGIDNFEDKEWVDNMPYYSRKNTALSMIKAIDSLVENFDKEKTIIIWRWTIWNVVSQNYWKIKQVSSISSDLLKQIKWKKTIIISTYFVEENKWFVNQEFLEKLPEWATIINASRKELVDEKTLTKYIEEKNIRYISDVYEWEKEQNPTNFQNVYFVKNWKIIKRVDGKEEEITKEKLDKQQVKVFLTPHVYWRWWVNNKEKSRKIYMYRKILWEKTKSAEKILDNIKQQDDGKTFLDMMSNS